MKRVLVTGATGFIGRHTLALLGTAGYEVHGVSSQPRAATHDGVEWHRADLLDIQRVNELMQSVRPSHLLHLAWVTKHGEYPASVENLNWVQTTIELMRGFSSCGGQRIAFAGTCFEYDFAYGCLSEELTPAVPATLYGNSKLAVGKILQSFANTSGLSAAWGRIFHLFGPSEDPRRFVPSIILPLMNRERAVCRNGDQLRDFLYVEDVASAFVALLESHVSGPVNIGSGKPIWLGDLATKIACHMGLPDLVDIRMSDGLAENSIMVPNVKKLREAVGWRAAFPLETGIEKTIQWWEAKHAISTERD